MTDDKEPKPAIEAKNCDTARVFVSHGWKQVGSESDKHALVFTRKPQPAAKSTKKDQENSGKA